MSVMEGEAEENGVKNGLEKGGDGELGELHIGIVRDA